MPTANPPQFTGTYHDGRPAASALSPHAGWYPPPSTGAQHLRIPCRPPRGATMATICHTGLPRSITKCQPCPRYPHVRFSSFHLAITPTWLSPRMHPGSSTRRCCWLWSRLWITACWLPARLSSASSWMHRTATDLNRCRTCSSDAIAVARLRRAHHGHTILCVVADDWSHRSSRTPERRAMLQRGPGLHDVRGLHPPVPSRTPGRGQMDHRAQRCHPRLLLLHPARLVETEVLRGVAEPCVRQWTTCSSLLATRIVRRRQ